MIEINRTKLFIGGVSVLQTLLSSFRQKEAKSFYLLICARTPLSVLF